MDEDRDQGEVPRRGRYRKAPKPIVRPGAPLTWAEVRAQLPVSDPDFLTDIERGQSEDLLPR
jgi:hypothetical protein